MVAAFLITATVFFLPPSAAADTKGADSNVTELPRSDWDFSILNSSNVTFPRYAVGQGFSAFFAGSADASTAMKLTASSGEAIAIAARPIANTTETLETVRAASVQKNDTRATFDGAWGDGARLAYEVGLGGVKESVVFDARPDGKGDLFVPSLVTFDQDALTPYVNGSAFKGYAHWAGDIVFANGTGVEHFRIPQAFAHDSGGKDGEGRNTVMLEYYLERRGGELSVSVVVPADFLDNKTTRYPITIDPTITLSGDYSDSQTYDGYTINVPSSLNLLSGSYLKINNTTMVIQGDLGLTVSAGATFIVENSTVQTDTATHRTNFDVSGTLSVSRSLIMNLSDGIEFWPTAPVTIESSWIGNSDGDGISVLQDTGNTFFVNNSTIQNVTGAGVLVSTAGQAHAVVTNSTIWGSASGLFVSGSTIGLMATNVSMKNVSGAAAALDHATASVERLSIRNALRAFDTSNSTLYVGNSTAVYIQTGTLCDNATTYLDQVNLYRISGVGVSSKNCAAIWTDGNYFAWTRSMLSTSIEVRHRLDILLLNATDIPLSSTSIAFYDALGASGAPTGLTDSGGWLKGTILKEFTLNSAGVYNFKSPHRIDVLISGTPSVHYYLGGRRSLTIHATADADADGVPNSWEDRNENITWIEAEFKANADDQTFPDVRASGDLALQAGIGGRYFTDLGWPTLNPGTYQYLVRAAGNGLGASLNLSANDTSGASVLAAETHPLSADYSWIASKPFSIVIPKSVVLNATSTVPTNSTILATSAILIDKVAVVRMKDIAGQPVGYAGGQMSDPLDNDTDFDGFPDGNESSSGRAWYEAETLAPTAPKDLDELASSGVSVEHPTGNAEILNTTLYRFSYYSAATYQLYARLRSTSNVSANATLTIRDGSGSSTTTVAVGANWTWVAGPVFTAGGGAPWLSATVTDLDDSDLNNAPGAITLDRLAVFNSSSFSAQVGWFNATNPMDGDADRDGLPDGEEVNGFFTADVHQAENYTSAVAVSNVAIGIILDDAAAWANYSVDVRYAGQYRLIIKPLLHILDGGGAIPYDTIQDLLVAEVRDANQGLVAAITAVQTAYPYTNQSTNENGWNQVGAFYDGRFNLSVGNYSVKVSIDPVKASELQDLGRDFRIVMDAFYVQKYRLNATDWDADSDGVPDGYEMNRSMLPLRVDSDYDTLFDMEEITDGVDGYQTSPIKNDTDEDGVLDATEVGLSGDDDPSSTTNPTDPDTDADGLPDGWVDGWQWVSRLAQFGRSYEWVDGLRQPWEGEDLDGNGAVDTSGYSIGENSTSAGGETDPGSPDTDNDTMDDGWEKIGRPWEGAFWTLDPRVNDSEGDADTDNLKNFEEYRARTNPYDVDTDGDAIHDGDEARIFLRTSVQSGVRNATYYPAATGDDWIYWDSNPYDGANGKTYSFANASSNHTADWEMGANVTRWLRIIGDGSLIVYRAELDAVVVWDRNADVVDDNEDGVLQGVAYWFARNESAASQRSPRAVLGFNDRELSGPVDPTVLDTDKDGVPDAREGFWNNYSETSDWEVDYDGDGTPAAADTDADGDGVADGAEDRDGDGLLEPEQGETATFAGDTDGDGLVDGNDTSPIDRDNDGLVGYAAQTHSSPNWVIPEYFGRERCAGRPYNTSYTNPDTDADGLLDGQEDGNHDCVMEVSETDPLDADTDDDGLFDGPLVRFEGANITPPARSWILPQSQAVENGTVAGVDAVFFQVLPWYLAEGFASYNLTNLTGRQYLVTLTLREGSAVSNVTRVVRVRLDGKAWAETPVTLDALVPSWASYQVGHVLVPQQGTHNLSVVVDAGGVWLSAITLTPINLSEGWLGTDPRDPDTDGDWLSDGSEAGLTDATVTADNWFATATGAFLGNQNGFWSNPTSGDTDGDGLGDGDLDRNGTHYGENWFDTNPASRDTDGDHLDDYYEAFGLGSDPTKEDTDGDWLPDWYEPLPFNEMDGDWWPAIRDNDTDNNGSLAPAFPLVSDYNSTEPVGGVTRPLTAVFRTNATAGRYWEPRTWIATNVSNGTQLAAYIYDANETSIPGSYWELRYYTHIRQDGDTTAGDWHPHAVTTFESYRVMSNGTHVLVVVSSSLAFRFRPWMDDGPLPPLDSNLTFRNGTTSNFKYRETINWSAIFLGEDNDGDGLRTWQENLNGTNASDPDTEHDGLNDGEEIFRYGSNPLVADSDGDNLTDGLEVHGWPGGMSSDPMKVDTDKDGLWDGNFSTMRGGMPGAVTVYAGEWNKTTNPGDPDTDGDGLSDGWEIWYGFNASNSSDSWEDRDYDWADTYEEAWWNVSNQWEVSVDGVWWNGTDPFDLDSDNDSIPDGWEMVFALDPLNQSDETVDPDNDTLTNAMEYQKSVVNLTWNWSRAWDPYLSADPHNNDTDFDGIRDDYELANATRADKDQDGIPSAVDDDSDGDLLIDAIEWSGWRVGVVNRSSAMKILVGTSGGSEQDFEWANVTSDPYLADTDNDTLSDDQEFEEFSNPRSNDTDSDFVVDADDRIWNPPAGKFTSTSTVQDLEPPEFFVLQWKPEDCLIVFVCANITYTAVDRNGVAKITFKNLGTSRLYEHDSSSFGWNITSTGWVTEGWCLVQLDGGHQYSGEYQIRVWAVDRLGNENQTIITGGKVFLKTKAYIGDLDEDALSALRTRGGSTGQHDFISHANDMGKSYGFDMAAVGGGAWLDDLAHGRILYGVLGPESKDKATDDPPGPDRPMYYLLEEWAWANRNWACYGDPNSYDGAKGTDEWVSFVNSVGRALNPFRPTIEDEENLTNTPGTISLGCIARNDPANASDWVLWEWYFYDGTIAGGWAYGVLQIAVSLVPIGTVMSAGRLIAGMAAKALQVGVPRAIVTEAAIAAKASIEIVVVTPEVGVAVARNAPKVLEETGGALAHAGGATDDLVKGVGEYREVLDLPASAAPGEIIDAAVEQGVVQAAAKVESVAPEVESLVAKEIGKAAITDPKAIRVIEEAWADPNRGPAVVKSALRELESKGIDPNTAFRNAKSALRQRGWVQEARVEAELLDAPSTLSVEQVGFAKVARLKEVLKYRADRVLVRVENSNAVRIGVEVKDTTAKQLVEDLRAAVKAWKEAKDAGVANPLNAVHIGKNRIVREIVVGPGSNAKNLGCAASELYLPSETLAALRGEFVAGGKDTLAFIKAAGWRDPAPFTRINSDLLRVATGAK